VPSRGRAHEALPAFGALHLPALVGPLAERALALRVALGVVLAVAALAGDGVAQVAMAVALARPAQVAVVLRAAEVPGDAVLALVAGRPVGAADAARVRRRPLHQEVLQLRRRQVRQVDDAAVHADGRVPVAIFDARHALPVVGRVADEQRLATLALRTLEPKPNQDKSMTIRSRIPKEQAVNA